jgi:hypothetical protein
VPAQYDAIKKSELKSGASLKTAERIAAATYNKNRKPGSSPVTRYSDRKAQVRRAKWGLSRAFPKG